MSEAKRKSQGDDNKRKKKYRSDGTPIWGKRHVEGPGVWVSCVKGKEKQTIGEVCELFELIASELWPVVDVASESHSEDEDPDTKLSLEAQIANEVSAIKRPRSQNPAQRFDKQTVLRIPPVVMNFDFYLLCRSLNTTLQHKVIFISCKPPVDPVELVVKYVKTVESTGLTRTRYTLRLVPVSGTCVANIPEIQALCRNTFKDFFDRHDDGRKFKYKIELRVRNHTTIPRPTLIQHVAQCVPEGHTVDLDNPEIFMLVEVFKSICGISIVEDYYRLQKFNVTEIARGAQGCKDESESRVFQTKGKEAWRKK